MGVTSSCHPLCMGDGYALLAGRGLFQGIEQAEVVTVSCSIPSGRHKALAFSQCS